MKKLLHIYRNTPLGRETLLQSIYFCKMSEVQLNIYIPKVAQFLIYFKHKVLTVALERSYLLHNKNAKENALEIVKKNGLVPEFVKLEPKDYTAKTPVLSNSYNYMCCPRTISDLSSKVNIGHIGSNVRGIINNAVFPVLLPSSVFKEWKSITAFFGGSNNSLKVLEVSRKLSEVSGLPLKIFTFKEGKSKNDYEDLLFENSFRQNLENKTVKWYFKEEGDFVENLFYIDHDSLVVIGSFGHGILKDLIFGSKMEATQANLPNNLLIVGANYNDFEQN